MDLEIEKKEKADTKPKCPGCSVKEEFCQGCIINIQEKFLKYFALRQVYPYDMKAG